MSEEMTEMQRRAYDAVREIQEVKREAGMQPAAASIAEIGNSLMVELKEALNELVISGKLSWHKNVNGTPFFTTKEKP